MVNKTALLDLIKICVKVHYTVQVLNVYSFFLVIIPYKTYCNNYLYDINNYNYEMI